MSSASLYKHKKTWHKKVQFWFNETFKLKKNIKKITITIKELLSFLFSKITDKVKDDLIIAIWKTWNHFRKEYYFKWLESVPEKIKKKTYHKSVSV